MSLIPPIESSNGVWVDRYNELAPTLKMPVALLQHLNYIFRWERCKLHNQRNDTINCFALAKYFAFYSRTANKYPMSVREKKHIPDVLYKQRCGVRFLD